MIDLADQVVVVFVVDSMVNLDSKLEKLLAAGYKSLEITLRTKFGLSAISYVKERYPEVTVGAGTVTTVEELKTCIDLGAEFCVAPGLNPDLVAVAQNLNFDFIPGVATPSEVDRAVGMGLELVKVFPIQQLGGTGYIKALSGPFRNVKFMPTGGVTERNYQDYLSMPSVECVGGSWMVK